MQDFKLGWEENNNKSLTAFATVGLGGKLDPKEILTLGVPGDYTWTL